MRTAGAPLTSVSSGHAEQPGEYCRLACRAPLRLLASRFASQISLSYRSRRRSYVNLDAGGRWKAKPVVGAFVHTLWTSVWKYERLQSPKCLRGRAKAQTTADLCFAYPHRGRTHEDCPEDCGVTSERTF